MSLYLVQALYGSKDNASAVVKEETRDTNDDLNISVKAEVEDGTTSESPSAPTQSDVQPLHDEGIASVPVEIGNKKTPTAASVEAVPNYEALDAALTALKATYQAQSEDTVCSCLDNTSAPVEHAHIHPTRQQRLLSPEEVMNVPPEETNVKPCSRTGSNVLPPGTQSGLLVSYPSATATKYSAASQVSPNMVVSRDYKLQAMLSRYLPPAGPYVDQIDLAHIPGLEDTLKTGDRCATCWAAKHPESTGCGNRCIVCGTTQHPGYTCPLLFCSTKFYSKRKVLIPSNRQVRPNRKNLLKLKNLKMVPMSVQRSKSIIPNRNHPFVREFYKNEWPFQVGQNLGMIASSMEVKSGHIVETKAKDAQAVGITSSSSQNSVDASLDPRLVSRRPKTLSFCSTGSSSNPLSSTVSHRQVFPGIPAAAEEQFQKLEEEVLRLRTENIRKDREIRVLRGELERMCTADSEIQTGNKRPRVYNDESLLATLH